METIDTRFEQALVFASVVETGSFTAAAERLDRSKSYVSKAVSDLERSLGVQLLLRTTRRLNLTEAGATYIEYCKQLRQTMDEATRAVSATHSEVAGTLRISAPTAFGDAFLPQLIDEFLSTYPRLRMHLELSVVQRDVVGEGFDFVFRNARTIDDRLVAYPLGVLREVVVASPTLLQQYGTPTCPAALARMPAVCNSHLVNADRWRFRRGAESVEVHVEGRFSSNLYGALRRAAILGTGVALLPRFVVHHDLGQQRLVQLLPEFEADASPLFLVYPQRRHVPLRHRAFRDFVPQWFARPGHAEAFE